MLARNCKKKQPRGLGIMVFHPSVPCSFQFLPSNASWDRSSGVFMCVFRGQAMRASRQECTVGMFKPLAWLLAEVCPQLRDAGL